MAIGVLVASLLPAFIVPHFGWRAVFLFGLIPALLAVYVRKSLSEPKIWEQNNDTKRTVTKEAAGNLTTTEAEQLKQMKSSHFESYLQIKSNANNNWSYYYVIHPELRYYGIFTWMPTILANKYNYTLAKASGWMFISTIGMLIELQLLVF